MSNLEGKSLELSIVIPINMGASTLKQNIYFIVSVMSLVFMNLLFNPKHPDKFLSLAGMLDSGIVGAI